METTAQRVDGKRHKILNRMKAFFSKILNHMKAFFSKPSNIILVIFAVLLTITVIIPLLFLLLNTFQVHNGESGLGKPGTYTFNHWKTF